MTEKKKPVRIDLKRPLFVEIVGQGSGMGKSLLADRVRDFLRGASVPTHLIRIESDRLDLGLREGDIHIPSEQFARAADMKGGLAGVVQPVFTAILGLEQDGGAVVVDWASGLSNHREKIAAATMLDHELATSGISHICLVVTTRDPDRMNEALALIRRHRAELPSAKIILALNAYGGDFDFALRSEQGDIYMRLLEEAGRENVWRVPVVEGLSLQTVAVLGKNLPEIIASNPREVAEKLKLDRYIANTCLSYIAAFHMATEVGLQKFFPLGAVEGIEAG